MTTFADLYNAGTIAISVPTATVTVTIASPAVFTDTAHGFSAGQALRFATTGALPTGLVGGTTYYVIAAGLTANAYEVSATAGGSAINTSGSQSGVHTRSALTSTFAGTGVLWSDIEEGDLLVCQGLLGVVNTITGAGFDGGTLKTLWPGAGGSGLSYVIMKFAKGRYDPALTQAKLREFLALMDGAGIIYAVTGAAPDVSVGEDGNYALKSSSGPWMLWLKVAGFWVLQANMGGTVTRRSPAQASTIAAAASDVGLEVDTSGGAVTVTLPAVADWVTANPGMLELYIIDRTGNAATNNITPTLAGSDTFVSAVTPKVRSAFGNIRLRPNTASTKWNTV